MLGKFKNVGPFGRNALLSSVVKSGALGVRLFLWPVSTGVAVWF